MTATDSATSLPALLEAAAQSFGPSDAIICQNHDGDVDAVSFAALRDRVLRLAGWLFSQDVKAGDRVAVMLPNTLWWPLTWLACAELGAVVVAVNAQARDHDLSHVLKDSRADVLVTCEEIAPIAATRVLLLPRGLPGGRVIPTPQVSATSVMSIQYTSGTSGTPKGCVLTHGYWIQIAKQAACNDPAIRPDDVLLTAQPFSYIDPQWQLTVTLLLGCPLVLLDGFHPTTFLQSVARHKATIFYCLGAMPNLLLTQDLSVRHHLRAVLCSGIPAASHLELERRLGVPWYELYGSTEIGGAALGISAATHVAYRGTGTLGQVFSGFEAGVEQGELLVRSENFMVGYLRPDGSVEDPRVEGWFHTGDLVTEVEPGVYRYQGRCVDSVRRGGENISAAEVERVIEAFPGVELVAVLGEKDELRGEEVHAVVMGVDGHCVTALHEHCMHQLARFKVPRYWTFRDLPMTASGKVSKGDLRALLNEQRDPRFDAKTNAWLKPVETVTA